ncbi:hypothetical protein T02_4189 [Trichinella nativa]|uniref:Uncharacterized protein n=1 Tax=Trichinella nativa TaxID=6335 RepID=A0A0V1KNQ6_9BILA|nr:hypothetical protein T02_4189 [Trichinella nativa]
MTETTAPLSTNNDISKFSILPGTDRLQLVEQSGQGFQGFCQVVIPCVSIFGGSLPTSPNFCLQFCCAFRQLACLHKRFRSPTFRRKQQRGECVRVFAGHLRRLFSKAFPEMSGSADKILLQQFKAGLSAEAVKTAVLRSEMDNFAEAVEVAVTDKRVVRELTTLEERVASLKTDAHQEDEPTAGRVTKSAAAAVTTRKDVLCQLPAAEQLHTEGCSPAPEDPRYFGRAGVCTMVFDPGPDGPRDPTTAALVGWRELDGAMFPDVSRDMHVLWQQRRSWVDEDGLIWRHRRGLTAEEGAKQALVQRAL